MLISMPLTPGLDPDLLRSFAFIAEEGSFTRAAQRVGRTQGAVSMQVQRLEALLGHRLLTRGKGGAVHLTPHGQHLLARARSLLALNDEIWASFREPALRGAVRLGTPDDYALRFLPAVLRRFAEHHPAIEVEVLCAPSDDVVARLKAGDLDLAVCSEGNEPPGWPALPLWTGPLVWITSTRHAPHRQDPLPLAVTGTRCVWTRAALGALDRVGRAYRVAYRSASQLGTHAPVLAGLAVTLGAAGPLPDGLRIMRGDEDMPSLPPYGVLLLQSQEAHSPIIAALARHITDAFAAEAPRILPAA
jgi:DNA-binding transcriptional LysR family regulator